MRTWTRFLDGHVASHCLAIIPTASTSHCHDLHHELVIVEKLIDERFFIFSLLGKLSETPRCGISEKCELSHRRQCFFANEKFINIFHHDSRSRKNLFLLFNKSRIIRPVFHSDLITHYNFFHRWDALKRSEFLGKFSLLLLVYFGFQTRDLSP